MQIVAVTPAEQPAVDAFVARYNPLAEHHIGYFGVTAAEILENTSELTAAAVAYVAAYDDDSVVGMLAVEIDHELSRAWLFGPIVAHAEWQSVADRLYAAVLPAIPATIAEHEIFCDVDNRACIEFARRHGFAVYGDWDILCLSRNRSDRLPLSDAELLSTRDSAAVRELHDRLFPTANLTGQQLVTRRGEHARTWVISAGDQLLGYSAATVEPASGEAFIDFIGVHEAAQGRGIGTRLLGATLRWLFGWERVQQVCLSVSTINEAAQALYHRNGFERERTMRAFRRRDRHDRR